MQMNYEELAMQASDINVALPCGH